MAASKFVQDSTRFNPAERANALICAGENHAAALPHSCSQPPKHIVVCRRAEITEALGHDNGGIEPAGLRRIIADVRLHVGWSAPQFTRLRDRIRIPLDADH